ncbi:protein FLX-like 1 isoform X1 [Lolium rigidum]|uniref:protein FLX-like 1 isoform X1 n=1 Tax=Lolium rigidum TaxID=89674 RepID=UPI001F5D2353|nr:protein FLX-like 1 isoform X1 [Lolium rigidum]XP_047055295.1 protein FLX-like 1 isoform X1 [Lolium rigidum]XP_047055296.1 protein FLX-like 1 isoform X1 [Lolium rigidum]
MAHRGQSDGRTPGLMRHGAFSTASLSACQPLEPSPPTILDILENKLAALTGEAEKLIRENHRLASSHVVLRQDIVETEKEMQMIRSHLGDVQVETDMHIRDLVERIRLMEADIQAGDAVKKELHQVHMEAKRLITERQMLTSEIQIVTEEMPKFPVDNNNLPELVAELDGLRKEHHSLRSAFEYEKNTNIKQVEQMRTMEVNLITMTKEADKLRADVANATNRAHAGAHVTAPQPGTAQAAGTSAVTNPYANAYANHPSAYQQGTAQAAAYQQGTPQAAPYQQGTPQAAAYQQGTHQTAPYHQGTPQAAAYQQGNPQAAGYQQGNPQAMAYQHGAYQQGTPQAGAYQQGTPQAGAYQQGTPQAGGYAYPTAYDANAYQMHANAYAAYSGYPVAGYAQPGYPGTYAAPQHPTTSGAATDGTNVYGAAASTGYPAPPVQASSGAANPGQAPPAPYPATYDSTSGAQR